MSITRRTFLKRIAAAVGGLVAGKALAPEAFAIGWKLPPQGNAEDASLWTQEPAAYRQTEHGCGCYFCAGPDECTYNPDGLWEAARGPQGDPAQTGVAHFIMPPEYWQELQEIS